jgi:hypothetical protein
MSLSAVLVAVSLVANAAPSALESLLDGASEDHRALAIPRLSGEELQRYSGVGALNCRVDGRDRTVTAFLVGAFDVVVTVAHAFEDAGRSITPSDCTFINTASDGRVVERIGVVSFRSKWLDDPSTRGRPGQDIAVAKLERISDFAQRTLPFKKFDGTPTEVTVVGYQTGRGGEWIKGKSPALADAESTSGVEEKIVWVDRNLGPSASGAPVIDAASGAVIGVNQGAGDPRDGNLLVIDDWLTGAIRTYVR